LKLNGSFRRHERRVERKLDVFQLPTGDRNRTKLYGIELVGCGWRNKQIKRVGLGCAPVTPPSEEF
jgi:hypothetical protein